MIEFKVKDIAEIAGARLLSEDKEVIIKGFSTDTRTLKAGDFFIAIKGKNFDGHDFAEKAISRGAAGLILQDYDSSEIEERCKHILVVKDTVRAMSDIAREIRKKISAPVVCITGTNGKTTVKDITAHVLSKKFNVLKNKKSYNNVIGLSLTLFDFDESYNALVLELGSNHPGEIEILAEIASPTTAIITNIGNGHLEHFLTKQGIFSEKTSILNLLPESGKAFLNGDDEFLRTISRSDVSITFFGKNENNNILIGGIKTGRPGCNFTLAGEIFHIPLEGEHNIYNAAAAILVAKSLGLTTLQIRESLLDVTLPDMRLEKIVLNNITFINDAYNANPDSFECALKVLEKFQTRGKRGVIAGDMLELGSGSDDFHKGVGRSIAAKNIDFVIAVGNKAGQIVQGAIESGMPEEMALVANNHEEVAKILKNLAGADDVVLVKGSRASKMEEILKCFTISYTR